MLTQLDVQKPVFQVIQPLYDAPEAKCSPENLGAIHMTLTVKLSLFALRAYLILIVLLVFYSRGRVAMEQKLRLGGRSNKGKKGAS
jgi:hypothetical protein